MNRPHPDGPLVMAYGLGVNSTAVLVEFARRGIRPDLILFADTGGEKPETYAYLEVIGPFLATTQFPPVTVVRYQPRTAPYTTLEQQCLHTGTLPSIAYGRRSCSIKYKKTPQERFVSRWTPARVAWSGGRKVVKVIGFDAGEIRRINRGQARKKDPREERQYHYWHPLFDWGWHRQDCIEAIRKAGLPVPMKSACFFCAASKKTEIVWLQQHHPELLDRALALEENAQAKLRSVKGLGRSFRWEAFLAECDRPTLFDCCHDDEADS